MMRKVSASRNGADRLGMIADDLTGGCDAGIHFARHGWVTHVYPDSSNSVNDFPELAVMVTSSRKDFPEEARLKVQSACEWLSERGFLVCFKKIDSTLRGNIGIEVKTVLESCGSSIAILAPSFPAMGRTLVNGYLQVAGQSTTERVHLPTLLRNQGVDHIVQLDLNTLHDGLRSLVSQHNQIVSGDQTFVVADSVSDKHLSLIVRAARQIHPSPLLVGSAGLAAHLAFAMAKGYEDQRSRSVELSSRQLSTKKNGLVGKGQVILFVGSNHPGTQAQLKKLREKEIAEFISLENESESKVYATLKKNFHLVVLLHWKREKEIERLLKLLPVIQKPGLAKGFIFSGGDTALHLCKVMEVSGIRLEQEIISGLPWGRLLGGPFDGLPVCTKAGGFGNRDALVVATRFLENCSQ